MFRQIVLVCVAPYLASALPGANNPTLRQQFEDQIREVLRSGEKAFPCLNKYCKKPQMQYEHILPAQPGVQWMDHGGYCGSWSIQRAAMLQGAWISQQQVRNHTLPGGGNDNEILATNIDKALKQLKLRAEGFDYQNLPTPQADAYRKWLKQKLVAGHGVVWMIMQPGERYPVYSGLPENNVYGHIEPVVGILSDKPLSDPNWYDEDVVVHFTDADTHSYYRTMESLPDSTKYTGNCRQGHYTGYPCINDQWGFGWAIEGLMDEKESFPVVLTVQPSKSEPDIRTGSKPEPITGMLNITGLTAGSKYAIYRWDSVETAFDYSSPTSVNRFTASGPSESYTDSATFSSGGSTYYRCIADSASVVV